MFSSSSNRVKFQDQQLDDYVLENSVLKSKLQSKIDALVIMSKELDKCSMERDRFKVLVEQFKYKNKISPNDVNNISKMGRFFSSNTLSGSEMLAKTRDHNNILKMEVETLQSKLEEATEDIVALRKQLQKKEQTYQETSGSQIQSFILPSYCNQDYERLVQELEKFQKKVVRPYRQIQLDYRAILDEKEELVCDRDYYKSKVQRLSHQISFILTNRVKSQQIENQEVPSKPIVDIDGLVTENKYLHERITQLQVEKEIIKRTLTKYKTILENRNKSDSLYLKKGFADVMTQKQVREFLDSNSKTGSKRTSAMELKSLCLGLFEALNDKSIALQHQRKTNQILANRITELEKTLESWCNGPKCVPIFPAQMLLDELLPENCSVKSDEPHEKTENFQDNCDHKLKYVDSDGETSKDNSDGSSGQLRSEYENGGYDSKHIITSKTVLPHELEELVREALAELKDNNSV